MEMSIQDWSDVNVIAEEDTSKRHNSKLIDVLFVDPSMHYEKGLALSSSLFTALLSFLFMSSSFSLSLFS